ncbi:MAG: peroxiredoxin [Patescibacteria group bacterium]
MTPAKKISLNDPAPNFTLKDEKGNLISLSDFLNKKKIILFFYQGDMTPACTMQLCAVRDDWNKFINADTTVLAINQGNAESHKKFKAQYNFPFPLLVDPDLKTGESYNALAEHNGVKFLKRLVVAIDKTGKIKYLRHGMPENNEILKSLK